MDRIMIAIEAFLNIIAYRYLNVTLFKTRVLFHQNYSVNFSVYDYRRPFDVITYRSQGRSQEFTKGGKTKPGGMETEYGNPREHQRGRDKN